MDGVVRGRLKGVVAAPWARPLRASGTCGLRRIRMWGIRDASIEIAGEHGLDERTPPRPAFALSRRAVLISVCRCDTVHDARPSAPDPRRCSV